MKEKVIVICGPTASGKTALSIELAKKINGEIISADSMQIYKEMNIGTAKPTIEEMEGIKHYLLDFVSPDQRYNVVEYQKDAKKAIKEIIKKIKMETRRYAKRQLTWFRKNKQTTWLDGTNELQNNINIILEGTNIG